MSTHKCVLTNVSTADRALPHVHLRSLVRSDDRLSGTLPFAVFAVLIRSNGFLWLSRRRQTLTLKNALSAVLGVRRIARSDEKPCRPPGWRGARRDSDCNDEYRGVIGSRASVQWTDRY